MEIYIYRESVYVLLRFSMLERMTNKLAHSDGVTGSWRDTLFIWYGEFEEFGKAVKCEWKGVWVGVDSGEKDEPKTEEVDKSKNRFTVNGRRKKSNQYRFDRTVYLLDNGDGLETHVDRAYELSFRLCKDGSKLVTATGSNEYGAFLSVGRLSDDGEELILARRYVEDGDPRASMSCKDVMAMLKVETEKDSMPWRDPIMGCNFSQPKTTKKSEHKKRKNDQKGKPALKRMKNFDEDEENA